MNTITREVLELAAKAAGKKAVFYLHCVGHEAARLVPLDAPPENNLFAYPTWQPHTDPADAWQLAADCAMEVNFDVEHVKVRIRGRDYVCKDFGEDTGRTAMEAVTLAAAEIGRAMG